MLFEAGTGGAGALALGAGPPPLGAGGLGGPAPLGAGGPLGPLGGPRAVAGPRPVDYAELEGVGLGSGSFF